MLTPARAVARVTGAVDVEVVEAGSTGSCFFFLKGLEFFP